MPRSVTVRPPGGALLPAREPRFAEVAAALAARGVGVRALSGFAAALAATAAFVLFMGHPGLGGILGLAALLASEASLLRAGAGAGAGEGGEDLAFARAAAPVVDLLVAAGLVGGTAGRYAPAAVALAGTVLALLAWLLVLDARREGVGPWTRADRLLVLLLGALLGRPVPALAALLVVGGLDAWWRLERLSFPAGFEPASRLPRALLGEDGRLAPAVRWGSLAAAVALFLVLPQSGSWRF
jgi:hypothetical protein